LPGRILGDAQHRHRPVDLVAEISTEGLTPILGSLPVSDLGLSNAELSTLLTGLEGGVLGGLGGTIAPLVSSLLSGHPSETLEQLVQGVLSNGLVSTVLGLAGATITPEEIVGALSPERLDPFLASVAEGLTSGQVGDIVSGLAGNLDAEELGGLSEGELALLGTAQLATLVDEALATLTPLRWKASWKRCSATCRGAAAPPAGSPKRSACRSKRSPATSAKPAR
jgi:hypothetical protein